MCQPLYCLHQINIWGKSHLFFYFFSWKHFKSLLFFPPAFPSNIQSSCILIHAHGQLRFRQVDCIKLRSSMEQVTCVCARAQVCVCVCASVFLFFLSSHVVRLTLIFSGLLNSYPGLNSFNSYIQSVCCFWFVLQPQKLLEVFEVCSFLSPSSLSLFLCCPPSSILPPLSPSLSHTHSH